MKSLSLLLACSIYLIAVSCNQTAQTAKAVENNNGEPDRTILPIREPDPKTFTQLDARDAKAPPRFAVKAPQGAPNVVIVLLDDIGFGAAGTFGGPCNMPTLDRVAGQGLKYNCFNTTALCSPTRVALLTGRNHHINNAGAIMELATGFPATQEFVQIVLHLLRRCYG
jgi:arylsulfatase